MEGEGSGGRINYGLKSNYIGFYLYLCGFKKTGAGNGEARRGRGGVQAKKN